MVGKSFIMVSGVVSDDAELNRKVLWALAEFALAPLKIQKAVFKEMDGPPRPTTCRTPLGDSPIPPIIPPCFSG